MTPAERLATLEWELDQAIDAVLAKYPGYPDRPRPSAQICQIIAEIRAINGPLLAELRGLSDN